MKRPTDDGPTLWDLLAASVANAVQALVNPSQPLKPRPPRPTAIERPDSRPNLQSRSRPAAGRKPRSSSLAAPRAVAQLVETKPSPRKVAKAAPKRVTMQDRYDALTRELLAEHSIRVRKWRTSMSGVAWELRYRDGTRTRLIESPKPKSPMSLAIFLHEVGHHAIGLGVYRPRCLEEYHAWRFALDQMAARGFPITDRVQRRYQRSMHYAVAKATRRGIKSLPEELIAFTGKMPK